MKLTAISLICLFVILPFSTFADAELTSTFNHNYGSKGNEIRSIADESFEKGFSLNGYDPKVGENCWKDWRSNADSWFDTWCDSTVSLASPSVEEISSCIQDKEVTFFYEIAHSRCFSTRFQNARLSFYRAFQLKKDMANRQPMKFAFIASCEGMRYTGPSSLSYELRKGYVNGTVTVGYAGMGFHPEWGISLEWQDKMFEEMNNGKTIKRAFDEACLCYPIIADYVRFVGDEKLVIGNNPPTRPEKPSGVRFGKIDTNYPFETKTFDPEGNSLHYLFDWGDGNTSEWIGPMESNELIKATYEWNEQGSFKIKVKAKDTCGEESNWSEPLTIKIPKSKSSKNLQNNLLQKLSDYFPLIEYIMSRF